MCAERIEHEGCVTGAWARARSNRLTIEAGMLRTVGETMWAVGSSGSMSSVGIAPGSLSALSCETSSMASFSAVARSCDSAAGWDSAGAVACGSAGGGEGVGAGGVAAVVVVVSLRPSWAVSG